MRLLVVEDSKVYQTYAQKLLGDLADITFAGSTLEAVDICQDFDLIILDIYTPSTHGWEATREFAHRCGRPTLIWTSDPQAAHDWPYVVGKGVGASEILRSWVKSYG